MVFLFAKSLNLENQLHNKLAVERNELDLKTFGVKKSYNLL